MANWISLWLWTLISFIRICKLFFFFIPFFFFFLLYYTYVSQDMQRETSIGKGTGDKTDVLKRAVLHLQRYVLHIKIGSYLMVSFHIFLSFITIFLSFTFCLLLSLFFSFPPFISLFSSPILSSIFTSFPIWFCSVLLCSVVFSPVLLCSVLLYLSCLSLYCIALYGIALYWIRFDWIGLDWIMSNCSVS